MDQRSEALRKANEVRSARAAVKRQCAEGTLGIELLAGLPDCCRKVPIMEILTWYPRFGPARAQDVCGRLGISAGTTMEALSAARRDRLIGRVRDMMGNERRRERRTTTQEVVAC